MSYTNDRDIERRLMHFCGIDDPEVFNKHIWSMKRFLMDDCKDYSMSLSCFFDKAKKIPRVVGEEEEEVEEENDDPMEHEINDSTIKMFEEVIGILKD